MTYFRPYLKIWEWELIFGRAVKVISSLGVRIPWPKCKKECGNEKYIACTLYFEMAKTLQNSLYNEKTNPSL